MDNYVLSGETAQKVQNLIDQRAGGSFGHPSGGGTRQVIAVRVTGAKDPTVCGYPCIATAFNGTTWEDYGDGWLTELNDRCVTLGRKYLAIGFAERSDGKRHFFCDLGFSITACGCSSSSSSSGSSSSSFGSSQPSNSGCEYTDHITFVTDVRCVSGELRISRKTAYLTEFGFYVCDEGESGASSASG